MNPPKFYTDQWELGQVYSFSLYEGLALDNPSRSITARFVAREVPGLVVRDVNGQEWWISDDALAGLRGLSPLEEIAWAAAEKKSPYHTPHGHCICEDCYDA